MMATITCRWVNKGTFTAQSWTPTILTRMIGWQSIREHCEPMAENIMYEHLGKNLLQASGRNISYMTPGTIEINARSWHCGSITFPVTAA